MKLRYSPAARDDLRQLKAYLTTEFGAAVAAKSAAKSVSEISALKRHRSLARPLSGKVGRDTPYLYLLCGKHSIAILSKDGNLYSVVRILDGRTDYAKTAFSLQ